MRPEEARKLVGGYAAGILTSEERRALMAAALEDQALFDELAREQVLKELLDDPAARARLLAAVDTAPSRWAWLAAWTRRPAAWGVAGGLAAAAILLTVLVWPSPDKPPAVPVLTAMRSSVPEPPLPSAPEPENVAKDAAGVTPADKAARQGASQDEARAMPATETETKSLAFAEKGQTVATEPAPPSATPEAGQVVAAEVKVPPMPPLDNRPPLVTRRLPLADAGAATVEPDRVARSEGAVSNEAQSKAVPAPQPAEMAEARRPAPAGGVVGGLAGGLAAGSVAPAAARATFRAEAAPLIPYRLEVAGSEGKWTAAPAQSGFRKTDRLRVVFEPKEAGRLRVTSIAGHALLDADVKPGAPVNVEIPDGEAAISGSFREVPFEIEFRRLP